MEENDRPSTCLEIETTDRNEKISSQHRRETGFEAVVVVGEERNASIFLAFDFFHRALEIRGVFQGGWVAVLRSGKAAEPRGIHAARSMIDAFPRRGSREIASPWRAGATNEPAYRRSRNEAGTKKGGERDG